jgi:hypothetical protein
MLAHMAVAVAERPAPGEVAAGPTPEAGPRWRDGRRLAPYAALLAILGFALWLRLHAYGGLVFGWGDDDYRYALAARNLAFGHGELTGGADAYTLRVVFLAPVAAALSLFGLGDQQATLWPLLCSLGAVAATFGLGRCLFGAWTGAMAALIVAALPLSVWWATRLRPDEVQPVFMVGAMWAFCAAQGRAGRGDAWRYAVAGGLLALGYFVRESALLLLAVFAVMTWRGPRPRRRAALWTALGVATPLLAMAGLLVATGHDPLLFARTSSGAASQRGLWEGITQSDTYAQDFVAGLADPDDLEFGFSALALAGIAIALWRRRRGHLVLLAYAGVVYLYYETLATMAVYRNDRYLTVLAAPLALLGAAALAELRGRARLAAPAVLAGLVVIGVGNAATRQRADLRERTVDEVADARRALDRRRVGPVLATDYVWHAKLEWLRAPRGRRFDLPDFADPAFLTAAERERRRIMPSPPNPRAYDAILDVGGRRTEGEPANWPAVRRAAREAGAGWPAEVLIAGRATLARRP